MTRDELFAKGRCPKCNFWPCDCGHLGVVDLPASPAPAAEHTKERPGALDAFDTLKPGEPHWTLQGGDQLAPPTIFFWCLIARYAALGRPPSVERLQEFIENVLGKVKPAETDSEREELYIRASNSEHVAWDMQAYQKGHVSSSDSDAAYQQSVEAGGTTTSTNDDALQKLMIHRALRRAEQHLSEAAAQVQSCIEVLRKLDPSDEQIYLGALRDTLTSEANRVAPHRPHQPQPEA